MNFSIFGLGNVGSNVYKTLKNKKILTFSIKNRFNCFIKNNKSNYLKLFKQKNLFIELIGNIHVAFEILLNCIKNNNNFITANKDLISKYSFFINFIFNKNKNKIFYEASVCGAIPIINAIDNFHSKNIFFYFFGILNGTCNFILTNLKKLVFLDLIKLSIKKGLAEKAFKNDLLGIDISYKLSILISKIFNLKIFYYEIYLESIFNINKYIKNIYYNKKYISYCLILNNFILLNISLFITKNLFLKNTINSYNSIILNSFNSKKTFYLGIGAGGLPTSSSVCSDFYNSFNKKFFFKKKCIIKKNIMNKNYYCFNFFLKINFNYNAFFIIFILKIKFIKFYILKKILLKTKKIFYKKILFFLYFFKKNHFFINKIL